MYSQKINEHTELSPAAILTLADSLTLTLTLPIHLKFLLTIVFLFV